jgi:hypothetical protein
MSALPAIEALPAHLTARGGSPDLVGAEYLDVVKNAIRNHPRSLQKAIGPSEVSHPCARRIGYKLGGAPEINHAADDVPWLPTIGTSVHLWLEDAFTQANSGHDHARWLVELRVAIGTIRGVEITGSMDLYDRVTATIIDHKVVGPTTLKKYRASGPGQQYRGQIHAYGRGATRRGLPVDRVMIAFLPRNGELRDAFLWHEPYDEQVALDALQRAEGIALAVESLGDAAYAQLPTADAWCQRCPFYRANSTDPATGCPGDENARLPHGDAPFADLLAG